MRDNKGSVEGTSFKSDLKNLTAVCLNKRQLCKFLKQPIYFSTINEEVYIRLNPIKILSES